MRATRPASTQICGTRACPRARWSIPRPSESRARSEEHTSELQSLRQLVCRLLLEKKNFASPDGVLPGQVGTVVDQRVDVADVAATVVDLAVRHYLSISEATPSEWVHVRRNPPDAALTNYERAVYQQVLGDAPEMPLSALRTDLSLVREAMYTDVVSRHFFSRRTAPAEIYTLSLHDALPI